MAFPLTSIPGLNIAGSGGSAAGISAGVYAWMRARGIMVVTDPTFAGGAVGDNVHDDAPAINAAIAHAKAANGIVFFPQPSVAFAVFSEIPVHWGTARLIGEASGNPLIPCIRAQAPMRSVLEVRTTFDLTPPDRENEGVARGLFQNLTIDANSTSGTVNARQAILENGDQYSTFTNVQVQNALESGVRSANIQAGVTIGAITQVGGGAAITITQADLNFYAWQPLGLSGGTLKLTVTGGGTTYSVTYNGVTQLGDQAIRLGRPTNITITDSSGRVTGILGLKANWGASVVNGTTYTTTVTPNAGDLPPNFFAGNGPVTYNDVWYDQCGSFYHTAGLPGSFGFYNTTTIAGNLSATAGSQVLTASAATQLMNQVGAGYSRIVVMLTGPNFLQGYIVDDLTMVTVVGEEPVSNLTNVDYGVINLAGHYEDGIAEGALDKFNGGGIANCVCGISLGGQNGGRLTNITDNVSIIGLSIGGNGNNACAGVTIDHWHSASNAANTAVFAPGSSGTVIDPEVQINVFGTPTAWTLVAAGNVSPLAPQSGASFLPTFNIQLLPSTQTLTATSQAIVPADQAVIGQTGKTSYVQIAASAGLTATHVIVLNGAPTIAPGTGTRQGQILVLQNVTGVTLIFQDTSRGLNSGLMLENRYVAVGNLEYITFQFRIFLGQSFWVQIGRVGEVYETQFNFVGNTGEGRRQLITSNNTPTSIWDINAAAFQVAEGTIQKFDITAQSSAGVNVAAWLGNVLGYDLSVAGHRFFTNLVAGIGTNAGAPPAGWAITVDPSGTPGPNIFVTGDNSGNPISWLIVMQNRDPGRTS